MTPNIWRQLLDLRFMYYRVYEEPGVLTVVILNATVRLDLVAPLEDARPAGVLVHFVPANWFQRMAWTLGFWEKRDWL